MKKRIVLCLTSLLLASSLLFSSCGKENESKKNAEKQDEETLSSKLEDGTYYIRHYDKKTKKYSYKPLYFNNATFEQITDPEDPAEAHDVSRVLWFKDDFKKVPTLNAKGGDELVFYSTTQLTETFKFERFEDTGYSIGLAGMRVSPSGRCLIATDEKKANTYPGGDTDSILNLKNDNVIIDSVNGFDLRTVYDKEDENKIESTPMTPYGSLMGLKKNAVYKAKVFEGTEQHDYKFKANVRILGSFEDYDSHDFEFKSKYLAKLNLPGWFNSGYYMVNGFGVFRYQKEGTKKSTLKNMKDYNIPNVNPDDTENQEKDSEDETTSAADISEKDQGDSHRETINIADTAEKTVKVTFKSPENGEGMGEVSGLLQSPSKKQNIELTDDGNGGLIATFTPQETGDYSVVLFNLSVRTPNVTVE